jgi:hypothetical protein
MAGAAGGDDRRDGRRAVKTMPDGQMWIDREPEAPAWWQFRARSNKRRYPLPDPQPCELYVQYLSDRDPWGNIRYVLYWFEPWAQIEKNGVTAGTLRCQAFFSDDRPCFEHWARAYERVVMWPEGADVTEIIREWL